MKPTTNKPQIITHTSKSLAFTLYDTKWVPSSAKFVVIGNYARGTGTFQVFELNQGKVDLVTEVEKHAAFKCGTFGASTLEERHLATGDFEGRVSIWDLQRTELPTWTARGHNQIINSIDGIGGIIGEGAPEIVTGSRDGKVCVWDPRTKNPVVTLPPVVGKTNDCWAVTFGNSFGEERCVCAGYDSGDLKLFDLRTNSVRWETNIGSGICSIEFDRKDIEMNKLLVTSLDGKIRLFDMRTFHSKQGYSSLTEEAHGSTVWSGRHLPQNRDIWMTSGGNGALNLYKYNYPKERKRKDPEGEESIGVMGKVELLCTSEVSSQPVLCFDWNTDKEGLCVYGSLDQSVRVGIVTKLKNY